MATWRGKRKKARNRSGGAERRKKAVRGRYDEGEGTALFVDFANQRVTAPYRQYDTVHLSFFFFFHHHHCGGEQESGKKRPFITHDEKGGEGVGHDGEGFTKERGGGGGGVCGMA